MSLRSNETWQKGYNPSISVLLKRPSGPPTQIRSGPVFHLSPLTSSKSNSCLVSLRTYRNAASPVRASGVHLARDRFAEDGESPRAADAHQLIVDPMGTMHGADVYSVRSFHSHAPFRCKQKKPGSKARLFAVFVRYTKKRPIFIGR